MDTSAAIPTDSLGRRSGPRQRRSVSEKRRIVEESLRPGVSVAVVARRHEVNANSVFGWRRQYQKGLLGPRSAPAQASLVPVNVVAEEAPSKPERGARSATRSTAESVVQIEVAGGMRVRVSGDLAREVVRQLIEGMLSR
jgi:transposase